MSEKGDRCECCGRPGTPIGAGDEVRMRCVRHEYVVDAEEWVRARSAMMCAFTTEAELTAYFLRDYGAGLDMIQAAQRDPDESDPEIKH